ncbi:MAG: hypothetical protein EPN79_15695 [Burkholderiaceae bacterium]|nr:MAG: hypothetical protein EPN79_15695 [Burkholderiaceae bacterium]
MTQTPLIVQTSGPLTELEAVGANYSEQHVSLLIEQQGLVHALNQDGVLVLLYTDMDQESLACEALTVAPFKPDFMVCYWGKPGDLNQAILSASTPVKGNVVAVDGRGYASIHTTEPFDAVKHHALLCEAAYGVRRLMDSDQRAFVDTLINESQLELPYAVSLAQRLGELAAMDRKLRVIDSNEGLSAEQERAQGVLAEQIKALLHGIRGVDAARFHPDPRGTTVGITFTSRNHNSLTGDWKVPHDRQTYEGLENRPFWDDLAGEDDRPAPSI